MDLTNEQWVGLEPLIGEMPRRADGRGRPWRSSREVLNGILWILRTGAHWSAMGRSAGALPTVPDVPPPVPALDP